jgi:hypothetical protein
LISPSISHSRDLPTCHLDRYRSLGSQSRSGEISSRLKAMPSLRIFRIEFDRADATYAPGELVTGNVIVKLTKEKTVRGKRFKGDPVARRRARAASRAVFVTNREPRLSSDRAASVAAREHRRQ